MKDLRQHFERLRDHAAECALPSAEAETKEKRELFARLTLHLVRAVGCERSACSTRYNHVGTPALCNFAHFPNSNREFKEVSEPRASALATS